MCLVGVWFGSCGVFGVFCDLFSLGLLLVACLLVVLVCCVGLVIFVFTCFAVGCLGVFVVCIRLVCWLLWCADCCFGEPLLFALCFVVWFVGFGC